MQELSAADQDRLGSFTRTVYHAIKSELKAHEGRSVDASRTRFWIWDDPHPDWAHSVICEIRRTDPSSLDLNIAFWDQDPGVSLYMTTDWAWADLDLEDREPEEFVEHLIRLLRD